MRIINTTAEYVPPDNPMTAEEIIDLCCEEVPFDPCAKEGRVSPYSGADQEDWSFDPDQELAKAAADNPKIISVSTEGIGNRPGEPCGQKYETWKGKNDCCDFVEPMAWDEANSAEVVSPGSRVIVGITGGRPPFYVSVRGDGFTLDGYRIRNGWVDTRLFWVYAADFSCGWCPITVDDGCSVAEGGVRCTVGQWVEMVYASPCGVIGSGEIIFGGTTESMSGKFKVRQSCAQNGFECTYPHLGACTAEQIADVVALGCQSFFPEEPPCFSLPAGLQDCENGSYWNFDGWHTVRFWVFSGYKAWEWQC